MATNRYVTNADRPERAKHPHSPYDEHQTILNATELAEKHLVAKIERENGDLHKTGLPEVELSREKIRQIRENLRLSQKQFAGATTLNISTVRNWEQGVRKPDQPARILLRLLDMFGEDIIYKISRLKK